MASEREHADQLPSRQGRQVLHSGVRLVIPEPYTDWDDDPDFRSPWDLDLSSLDKILEAFGELAAMRSPIVAAGTKMHEAMENFTSAGTHMRGLTLDFSGVLDEASISNKRATIVMPRGYGKSQIKTVKAIAPLKIARIELPEPKPIQKNYPGARSLRRRDNR